MIFKKITFIGLSLILPLYAAYTFLDLYQMKERKKIEQEKVLALFEHQKFYDPFFFREREVTYDVAEAERGKSFESLVTLQTIHESKAEAFDFERYERLYVGCLVAAWQYRAEHGAQQDALPSLKAKIYELYCVPEESDVYVSLFKSYQKDLPNSENSDLKERVENDIHELKKKSFDNIYELYVEPYDEQILDQSSDDELQL